MSLFFLVSGPVPVYKLSRRICSVAWFNGRFPVAFHPLIDLFRRDSVEYSALTRQQSLVGVSFSQCESTEIRPHSRNRLSFTKSSTTTTLGNEVIVYKHCPEHCACSPREFTTTHDYPADSAEQTVGVDGTIGRSKELPEQTPFWNGCR